MKRNDEIEYPDEYEKYGDLRAASQRERASTYLESDQEGRAMDLLEHIVMVRQVSLAEEHSDRLESQSSHCA